ncbi:MAG: hypothetical protein DWQ53_17355 [Microcystis flos-aquae DF17]|nr:MAG: hypothetical protein DWQ53_17355 [Microcystis flos-aquae DF17]
MRIKLNRSLLLFYHLLLLKKIVINRLLAEVWQGEDDNFFLNLCPFPYNERELLFMLNSSDSICSAS